MLGRELRRAGDRDWKHDRYVEKVPAKFLLMRLRYFYEGLRAKCQNPMLRESATRKGWARSGDKMRWLFTFSFGFFQYRSSISSSVSNVIETCRCSDG